MEPPWRHRFDYTAFPHQAFFVYFEKNNANVQTDVTTGVVMIIDRDTAANRIHIQTCYPDSRTPATTRWSVTDMASGTIVARG